MPIGLAAGPNGYVLVYESFLAGTPGVYTIYVSIDGSQASVPVQIATNGRLPAVAYSVSASGDGTFLVTYLDSNSTGDVGLVQLSCP